MSKLKQIFTNKRVLLLIAFILLGVYLIGPTFNDGVAIRGVVKGSAASEAYPQPFISPASHVKPTAREVIKSIDNIPIKTVDDYRLATQNLELNQTLTIQTNKQKYFVTTKPLIKTTVLNELEVDMVTKAIFNHTLNETQNVTVFEEKNKTIEEVIGVADIGLSIYERPKNNIQLGLDLQGGTRVLLEPEEEINEEDIDIVISNIEERLNVFGVNDVTVRTTKDFFGKLFISVEIAGVNEEEIKNLLTEQGEFAAKIGGETVFEGGNKDVLYVCRTATCSSIDNSACQESSDGLTYCGFRFSITLSEAAAEKQAATTANLAVVSGNYLSENLTLHLDGELVDELRIGASLKGNPATDIQISGSGSGITKDVAIEDARSNMKKLQTILVTGSLPVKLKIAKTDTISPVLGEEFINNAIYAGLLAILIVIIVVGVRYREWKIAAPMALAMLSEVVILLGFAGLIGWRIDMVAIAAIIIAIGSGVDDQIVITDETLSQNKKEREEYTWKQKIKKAFFIIMASYFTLLVAMLPLWFAGAGLLKGFALTTIAGVTIGVLITRPAFAAILEIIVEK